MTDIDVSNTRDTSRCLSGKLGLSALNKYSLARSKADNAVPKAVCRSSTLVLEVHQLTDNGIQVTEKIF